MDTGFRIGSCPLIRLENSPTSFANLGACLNSHCSILSESDSSLGYEQVFSPLEYRSDAASAAECAGLRAERPRLAVYRRIGAGEPRSQGGHGRPCAQAAH